MWSVCIGSDQAWSCRAGPSTYSAQQSFVEVAVGSRDSEHAKLEYMLPVQTSRTLIGRDGQKGATLITAIIRHLCT
jgi:hypothetical protein